MQRTANFSGAKTEVDSVRGVEFCDKLLTSTVRSLVEEFSFRPRM